MLKKYVGPALVGMALLLAACMVPEKFTAEYEIKPGGDFTFVYEGTMIDALTRVAKVKSAQTGEPMPDAAQMKEMLDEFKADPRVVEFKELGNETYQVRLEDKGNLKQAGAVYFLSKELKFWNLTYDPAGNTVTLAVSPLKDGEMDKLGIKMAGEFKLSTDCKIVSSSVKLDESLLGNTYSFKIDNGSADGVTVVMQLE